MSDFPSVPSREIFLKIAHTKMPFGRYKDLPLADLPEPYLLWMSKEGFPSGELGQMLALLLDMKVNGVEHLLRPLRPRKR